jgi:hypothetical protein
MILVQGRFLKSPFHRSVLKKFAIKFHLLMGWINGETKGRVLHG